jgi:hypothetical protein
MPTIAIRMPNGALTSLAGNGGVSGLEDGEIRPPGATCGALPPALGTAVPGPLAHFECERYALHGGDDHLIFGAAHQWHQLRQQFCTSARISDSARGRAGWSTESQYAANGGE